MAQSDNNSADDTAGNASIINLAAARRREEVKRRAAAGIVPETAEQVRLRMFQNVSAAIVVVALMVGGGYLIIYLRNSLRIEACLESGRKNCVRIDTTQSSKP